MVRLYRLRLRNPDAKTAIRSDVTTDATQGIAISDLLTPIWRRSRICELLARPNQEKRSVYEIPHMHVEYRDVSIRRAGDYASTIRTRQPRSPAHHHHLRCPGRSAQAPGQGTFPFDINPEGAITGFYVDASNGNHGFLRDKHGTIATFEAPGAGSFGTPTYRHQPGGDDCGWYVDRSSLIHSFLRAGDGSFTTFDPPGAGTSSLHGQLCGNHQPGGGDCGNLRDGSNAHHGYLRASDGSFTTFDAHWLLFQGTFVASEEGLSHAGRSRDTTLTGAMCGTPTFALPTALSPRSTFRARAQVPSRHQRLWHQLGRHDQETYVDASGVGHGFLRARDGTTTTFDVPGVGNGTAPFGAINPSGAITGVYGKRERCVSRVRAG